MRITKILWTLRTFKKNLYKLIPENITIWYPGRYWQNIDSEGFQWGEGSKIPSYLTLFSSARRSAAGTNYLLPRQMSMAGPVWQRSGKMAFSWASWDFGSHWGAIRVSTWALIQVSEAVKQGTDAAAFYLESFFMLLQWLVQRGAKVSGLVLSHLQSQADPEAVTGQTSYISLATL